MNYTFGLSVTLFNIFILIVLITSYIYHRLQIKNIESDEKDLDYIKLEDDYAAGLISLIEIVKLAVKNKLDNIAKMFHVWMFYITGFLLAANTFAFITGIFSYFIYKIESPDVMLFGRVSDRYTMLLAYIGLAILGRIFKRPNIIKPLN